MLAAPVVAVATCFGARYIDARLQPVLSAILTCVAGFGLLFNYSAWSWRNGIINTSLGAAVYIAVVTLAYLLASRIRPSWMRWLMRIMCAIPILVGLVLGTIGFLGLMFIVSDQVPRTVRQLTPKYAVEFRYQGGAVADTDYEDLTLVR